ncbi:Hypothetical predicted protein, partial [Lynx pardinus]
GEKGLRTVGEERGGEGAPRRPRSSRPRLQVQLPSAARRAVGSERRCEFGGGTAATVGTAAARSGRGLVGVDACSERCWVLFSEEPGLCGGSVYVPVWGACVSVCVCVCMRQRERKRVRERKEGEPLRDPEVLKTQTARRATHDLLGEPSKCEHGVCRRSCPQDATSVIYSKLEQGYSWEFL